MIPDEAGKNNSVRWSRGPLVVFGLLAAAVGTDYAFRASSLDDRTIGLARLEKGDVDGAIGRLGNALRRNPADPAARLALAQAYHAKGWVDEAVRQYEQAIAFGESPVARAYAGLGSALSAQGQPEAGLKHLRKSIELGEKNGQTYFNAGLAAEKSGKKTEACGFYSAALREAPSLDGVQEKLTTCAPKRRSTIKR